MVFNYGPRGASGEHIDFNPGIGGGKFNPTKHLKIKYGNNEDYEFITTNGVSNIYDFYVEQGVGWALRCYDNCDINIIKKIDLCDIGLVGGGGGGGGYGSAAGYNHSGGGGGGSGAQITSTTNCMNLIGEFKIEIGKGGAGATGTKDGSPGDSTIIRDLARNILYQAEGGNGGSKAVYQAQSTTWGSGCNYAGGAGGIKTGCSSGGKGGGTIGSGPWGNLASPCSGSAGQAIFNNSIFAENQIDNPIVAGGGGGGAGASGDASITKPASQYGDGLKYGRGGMGGLYINGTNINYTSTASTTNGEVGGSGLVIFRGILSS